MDELDLFAAAIAVADPAERAALLNRECAGRPDLRVRLDALLAGHQSPPSVIEPDAQMTGAYTPGPAAPPERTDMAGLVQGVVEMIRHMGKYRGKQIVFQPREAVMAHVDSQELKQVVLNLVVNALDSMESGGTLRIDARLSGGMAELVFADDGHGMTPDVLENIFEPFFTKRRVGKGTGLGLSITHRIVSQHHGEIMASSPGEDRGATFTVRLPVRQSEDDSSDDHGAVAGAAEASTAGGRSRSRDKGQRAA